MRIIFFTLARGIRSGDNLSSKISMVRGRKIIVASTLVMWLAWSILVSTTEYTIRVVQLLFNDVPDNSESQNMSYRSPLSSHPPWVI